MDQPRSSSAAAVVVWVVVAAVIWFALLGYRDLADPDEGRIAEIAREIVTTGDWVTLRHNGYEYFAKPPLQFWATAAAFELFGQGEAAARLWVALAGFVGALWIGFVGYRLYGAAAGFGAFAVLVSSLLYVGLGHILTPNMSVAVFMGVGLGAFVLAQSARGDHRRVRRWMLVGWAGLALAVLSKGPMGLLLPGAAVFLYMLWQRDWALLRHLELGWGLLVFLLLAAPWFVAVSAVNPEFPRIFFFYEHFERYTSTVHGRYEPLYYFVPILLLGTLPWLWRLVQEIARPRFAWWPTSGQGFDAERFLWTYATFIFLFFSFSNSKLPAYLLPIFPALALLIGRGLTVRPSLRADALIAGVIGTVLLVAAVFVEHWPSSRFSPAMLGETRPWLAAAGLALIAGSLLARRLKAGSPAVASIALSALLAFQIMGWGYKSLEGARSGAELAAAVRPLLGPDTPVYNVGSYQPSIAFYLQRTLRLLRDDPSLDFDFEREPRDSLPSIEAFRAEWEAAPGQAIAIVGTRFLDHPAMQGLAGRVIHQGPRKSAIARR